MQHANPEGLLSDKENYKGPPRRNYLKAATFCFKIFGFPVHFMWLLSRITIKSSFILGCQEKKNSHMLPKR